MISINDYEKSSTYQFIQNMQEITMPLKKIGIKYFIYSELTSSYHISTLVNNDEMIREFIDSNGLQYELALSPHKLLDSGLYAISSISKPIESSAFYEKFFVFNRVSDEIVYIQDNYDTRKIYIFGILSAAYINYDYLELFILYFNDKAQNLIHKSDKLKIPKELIKYCPESNITANSSLLPNIEQEFLKSIDARYYMVKKVQKQYLLSNRESQCLELILQNKITKEIANLLGLTTRTTEIYIDNLKKKLHCRTKNELILKFYCKKL